MYPDMLFPEAYDEDEFFIEGELESDEDTPIRDIRDWIREAEEAEE